MLPEINAEMQSCLFFLETPKHAGLVVCSYYVLCAFCRVHQCTFVGYAIFYVYLWSIAKLWTLKHESTVMFFIIIILLL